MLAGIQKNGFLRRPNTVSHSSFHRVDCSFLKIRNHHFLHSGEIPLDCSPVSNLDTNARWFKSSKQATLYFFLPPNRCNTYLVPDEPLFRMIVFIQIATVGPASSSFEMLERLFLAGADIFRLNFSHGAHAEKAAVADRIRELEEKYRRPIAILADLQGPKLRVATFTTGKVELLDGQEFAFDLDINTPGPWRRINRTS